MKGDARRLGLIDLGRGVVMVVDELGSVWMRSFGPPVRWVDPMPESETLLSLTACKWPRRRP